MKRLAEIRDNVGMDSINVEKYVKELTNTMFDMTEATGRMFEQEHRRMINMVTAINPRGLGGRGCTRFTARGIMEHKVIMNLRMVSGDKSLFCQWNQRFIAALGQVEGAHEEIIQQLVRETDLGRELDKVVENLRGHCGEEIRRVSGDVWNILLDKAENEAYDKIKIVHKGNGVTVY